MSTRIASIPWTSAGAGNVFALVHNGPLLSAAYRDIHVTLEGAEHLELRVLAKRYSAKPTGSTTLSGVAVDDDGSGGTADIFYGTFLINGTPTLSIPDRCVTRGVKADGILTSGHLGLARDHTLVVELLDAVPNAARGTPLQFVVRWEE